MEELDFTVRHVLLCKCRARLDLEGLAIYVSVDGENGNDVKEGAAFTFLTQRLPDLAPLVNCKCTLIGGRVHN